jgi:hypothetical protein
MVRLFPQYVARPPVRSNANDVERILAAAHPERADAGVFWMGGQRIGDERSTYQASSQDCDSHTAARRVPIRKDNLLMLTVPRMSAGLAVKPA